MDAYAKRTESPHPQGRSEERFCEPAEGAAFVRRPLRVKTLAVIATALPRDRRTVMTATVWWQDGIVYQKDLGRNTDAAARAIKAYDPDSSWQKAQGGK